MPESTGKESNHLRARQAMVDEQLRRRQITDTRVLEVMGDIPRHRFVSLDQQAEAYTDGPLPIGEGQTISQPYMVALMLQQLSLNGHERVLEIGTGSGYQTALLCRLAKEVYSLEYLPDLANQARRLLQQCGFHNVRIITSDGSLGLPQYAPFDGIVVTAAAPKIPSPLLDQLADGGRLVIPVGTRDQQELLCITKHPDGYTEERSVKCRFVPLRGEKGWTSDG